jgi:hypothetical protein
MLIPLKAKYRISPNKPLFRMNVDPHEGTRVFVIGVSSKRAKTGGNSGHGARKGKKIRPRKRSYGPF